MSETSSSPYGPSAGYDEIDVAEPKPQAAYLAMRDRGRVIRDDEGITIFEMEDVLAVNRRRDVLGVGARGPAHGSKRPLIPLDLDGPEHGRYRKILDPLFAPRRVASLENEIRALSIDLIDQLAGATRADMYQAFCVPLPCRVFVRFLGMPMEDLDFLLKFKDDRLRPPGATLEEQARVRDDAAARMADYLDVELDRRARLVDGDGDDLISGFMRLERDGVLSREDVTDIVYLLLIAGLDTVSATLSCMLAWLAEHPNEQRALVQDQTLIPAAIEELLRFESPVPTTGRTATADFTIGDELVRAGETIRVMWCLANLDPSTFPEPLTVDFHRLGNRHVAFAAGFHRCLGSHLARLELRVALEELHRGLPAYHLDPEDRPVFHNVGVRVAHRLPLIFEAPVGRG